MWLLDCSRHDGNWDGELVSDRSVLRHMGWITDVHVARRIDRAHENDVETQFLGTSRHREAFPGFREIATVGCGQNYLVRVVVRFRLRLRLVLRLCFSLCFSLGLRQRQRRLAGLA